MNKVDYMGMADFDMQAFRDRVTGLNPKITIMETSGRTGQGIEAWSDWLEAEVKRFIA